MAVINAHPKIRRKELEAMIKTDIRKTTIFQEGREEGREEGLEEGVKKGREEGIEKGIEKGRAELQRESALRLRDKGLSISEIGEFLALTARAVRALLKGQ